MKSSLIGENSISSDAISKMRSSGGTWAAYQNHDLSSFNIGTLRFLKFGESCTFKTPPHRYPDSQLGTGWAYLYVGNVNLEKEKIE